MEDLVTTGTTVVLTTHYGPVSRHVDRNRIETTPLRTLPPPATRAIEYPPVETQTRAARMDTLDTRP